MFKLIIVCLIAGLGAGVGTGFAGMSAAAVIGPMLISFLDVPAYTAVGIGLASDVFASAISAYTYKKHKNIDLKSGLVMMLCVLVFTVVGSFVSSLVGNKAMGNFTVFMTMVLGFRFIFRPVMTTKEAMLDRDAKKQNIKAAVSGVMIGFTCGFVGAGGGMMMLMCLTSVLGYELKTAVGTSVFIMTFTALTGSLSHFIIGEDKPDLLMLALCVAFTFVFARISAKIANKASAKTLNRVTGTVLIILGITVLTFNLFIKK